MRRLFPALLISAAIASAAGLQIVRPAVSDSDGGPPNPTNSDYRPGDVLYFTCRVAGFSKDSTDQVRLAYTVRAVDAAGVALTEPYKNSLNAEVTPQDKDWLPKISTSISIPLFLFSGEYKVVVEAEDLNAKSSATLEIPFRVRAHEDVHRADSLEIQAFRFLRREDDAKPAERPDYIPGDHLWAKFDITGFRYGDRNKMDVTYLTSVLGPDGKTLWTQPEPTGEQGDSFYPRAFVNAEMGIELQPKIKPGTYTLVVQAKDAVGGQTCEVRQAFTILAP
jgi:hypothetical protein